MPRSLSDHHLYCSSLGGIYISLFRLQFGPVPSITSGPVVWFIRKGEGFIPRPVPYPNRPFPAYLQPESLTRPGLIWPFHFPETQTLSLRAFSLHFIRSFIRSFVPPQKIIPSFWGVRVSPYSYSYNKCLFIVSSSFRIFPCPGAQCSRPVSEDGSHYLGGRAFATPRPSVTLVSFLISKRQVCSLEIWSNSFCITAVPLSRSGSSMQALRTFWFRSFTRHRYLR